MWSVEREEAALRMVGQLPYAAIGKRLGVTKAAISGLVARASGAKARQAHRYPATRARCHNAHDDARYTETWEARKARRAREATA